MIYNKWDTKIKDKNILNKIQKENSLDSIQNQQMKIQNIQMSMNKNIK